LEFVKVASCGILSTTASSSIPPPLSKPFLATQKLPVKGHGQLRLAQDNLLSRFLTTTQKLLLKGHSRHLLERDLVRGRYSLSKNNSCDKPLVVIKNSTVLLAGYPLVGTQIAQVHFVNNSFSAKNIIDSNFDNILIFGIFLRKFHHLPRIARGQRIGPIHATVNTTVPRCVFGNLYSPTDGRLIQKNTKTYVVKRVSFSFNLGNYSANQYSITVVLGDSKGRLGFGNYKGKIQVEISTSLSGIAFKQSAYRKAWLEFGNCGKRLQAEISILFQFIDKDSLNSRIKYLWTPPSITSKKSSY